MRYLMKCGHVANATDEHGKPICVICYHTSRDADARTIDKEVPHDSNIGLEGRTARCDYCGKETPSKWSLPFFENRANKERDSYYCGCMGWD